MDYLMKLVITALEWSYQAGKPDIQAEKLERAAELLVLRRNTLRIIDGAGPSIEAPQSESTRLEIVQDAAPAGGPGTSPSCSSILKRSK